MHIKDRPCILLCNYGDDSVALVQWAHEAETKNIKVVYIDTGFAAVDWEERIIEVQRYIKKLNFETIHIKASITFQDAVRGRGSFPSSKFQWCTGILKGLPLLDWLDKIDLKAEAIILIAKRKSASPEQNIETWIETSEFYNDRSVWHPILDISEEGRDQLLQRAGFKPLGHRSLECHPCVNSSLRDLAGLKDLDIEKVVELEEELQTPLFADETFGGTKRILQVVHQAREERNLCRKDGGDYQTRFYRGCGNHFGCGL